MDIIEKIKRGFGYRRHRAMVTVQQREAQDRLAAIRRACAKRKNSRSLLQADCATHEQWAHNVMWACERD